MQARTLEASMSHYVCRSYLSLYSIRKYGQVKSPGGHQAVTASLLVHGRPTVDDVYICMVKMFELRFVTIIAKHAVNRTSWRRGRIGVGDTVRVGALASVSVKSTCTVTKLRYVESMSY